MSCKAQDWPNKKVGRVCCLSFPVKVKTWSNKKKVIKSLEDLVEHYNTDSVVQAKAVGKKQNRTIKPDDFFRWITKRGVCPYGVISSNTRYWLELMSVYDGEMGLNTPLPYDELPAFFFDVLRIHRENRPVEERKEP